MAKICSICFKSACARFLRDFFRLFTQRYPQFLWVSARGEGTAPKTVEKALANAGGLRAS